MTFDTFRTCLDKVPKTEEIVFSGMAEPWLNPDCTRMLKYAHQQGYKLGVFTTLVGMTHTDYDMLVSVAPAVLCLHIPDAEGNANFPRTEEYFSLLSNALDDVKKGRLHVTSFSCHGTLHPRIRKQVEDTGISVITEMHDRAGNLLPTEALNIRSSGKSRGRIICTRCDGDSLNNNVLLPDGTMILCCMDYGLDHPLGNLLVQSYNDVIEGKQKKHYRHCLAHAQAGEIICRSCISGKVAWQWYLYKLLNLGKLKSWFKNLCR